MPIRVSQVAYAHAADIDVTKTYHSDDLDKLINVCVYRATDALKTPASGYTKEQCDHIGDIFKAMQATNRTIHRVLQPGSAEPGSVDALSLARQQLEGLYALCLMFEQPKYVTAYTQDYWRKRYVQHLLFVEETKSLARMSNAATEGEQQMLQLRFLFGISEAQHYTVAFQELGRPLPPGMQEEKIPKFPAPGATIPLIMNPDERRMLERLYLKYVELCSFAHGLAHANLYKNVYDRRSPHRGMFDEQDVEKRFQLEVRAEALILSFLSIAQATAELTRLYPNNIELPTAASDSWKILSQAHFLTRGTWEIRTRTLLGII